MDVFKVIAKLIKDDSQEMKRIRDSAPNRLTPDRAHRYVQLYNRVDALTDILGHRKRIERAREDQEILVVVAGPNPPQALTLEEISDVLAEFESTECGFWARTESGGLEPVWCEVTGTVKDEAFIYFTSQLSTTGANQRIIGTCSWSRRRPT